MTFTYYIEPHVKPALSCAVPGHTLIHACMVHGDDLYDERVHPFLTHQHLVVIIWTDGFAVQVPADIWAGESSDLNMEESKQIYFVNTVCASPLVHLL